jgi:hypothetical protein
MRCVGTRMVGKFAITCGHVVRDIMSQLRQLLLKGV